MTADPERTRNGLGKTLATTLDKSVISEVASDPFKPQPIGAKLVQLPFQFSNRRRVPR
jgi:hypothetical protein